ncbi:MAG: hypothetical protein ABGY11_10140 [Candidatus Thioglobus sp.]|jgi:hypothetical protein
MTRTIQTEEAIEKCYRVVMSTCDPATTNQCAAWLETLRILKSMGFNRVAYEERLTKE